MINGLKMIVVVDLVGGFIGRVNSLYTCMMVAERRTSTQYEVEAQRSSLASRTVKRISVLRTSIKRIKLGSCSDVPRTNAIGWSVCVCVFARQACHSGDTML